MPLTSVKVLDLTRLLPGPYCTMILADFGAEVIKVEDPHLGDYARHFNPKINENSALFHSLNRNKKSICLNLKEEADKKTFLQLAKKTDIMVESFRPGVMKRLGLDYETLKEENSGLIYCSITGYGQTGPYANRPGHDINYISYAGLLDLMGEMDGPPVIPAATIADIGGGAFPATVGILLALLERNRSGKGQFIDISMLDGVISWLQPALPNFLAGGTAPNRGTDMLSGGRACYAVYETKDGRYLSVGAIEQKFWEAFCQIIGCTHFIPLLEAPLHEQHLIKYEIQKIILQKSLSEWMEAFSKVEACVSPVLTLGEMTEHAQVAARGILRKVYHHRMGGEITYIHNPIKMSETKATIRHPAPGHGEHTVQIISELIVDHS